MTNAEVTVMKMGDGGFRPAYNPQIASDAGSLVITGRDVATIGSDQGQMAPMIEPVIERCGQTPEFWRVESGHVGHEQIEQASRHTVVYGCRLWAGARTKDKAVDARQAKAIDSPVVVALRERMGSNEAKTISKKRAATAECVHAQSRNRSLQQFRVRGWQGQGRGVVLRPGA
jgi:hypothetical protein